MRLVFPSIEYKEKAIEFIQEFYDNNSEINGSGGLDGYLETSTYEEWLLKVCDTFNEEIQMYVINR